jgi:hypothetical protein
MKNKKTLKMKFVSACFFLCILLILFSACGFVFGSKYISIHFSNRSERTVDSVIFSLNGQAARIVEIAPRSVKHIKILRKSVPANAHDISIESSAYMRDTVIRAQLYYNDLTGSFDKSYSYFFTPDFVLKYE